MKKTTKNFFKKIMPNSFLEVVRRIRLNTVKKESYSQCGEDIIVNFLFDALDIKKPSYADIGAHHASFINNTYFFYKKGCRGLCVEPDPILFSEIKKKRGGDICLNVGVGNKSQAAADYYVMTSKTLSTFSREEVEEYEQSGRYGPQKVEKILQVPLVSINELTEQYPHCFRDFVSLDTEGFDLEIIQTFDFFKIRPKIWCVETVERKIHGRSHGKNDKIIQHMIDNDYFPYADTYINTIFVDRKIWKF